MNPAVQQALRTMMTQGATRHALQVTQALQQLIEACVAGRVSGFDAPLPHVNLQATPAVIGDQVLRDAGLVPGATFAVADIAFTSHPEFAGRTPRDCLEQATKPGDMRRWGELMVNRGAEALLGECDRRLDLLVLPDGRGIVHAGTARWSLARIVVPGGSFRSAQCRCTEVDERATLALANYRAEHPHMRLARCEPIGAAQQKFQFRGESGELEVLTREELIAGHGRLRAMLKRAFRRKPRAARGAEPPPE